MLEGPPARNGNGLPRFTGLRTARFKYVEYLRAVELYDLARDPHELRNLAGRARVAAVQRRFGRRLARLRGCAGAGCR